MLGSGLCSSKWIFHFDQLGKVLITEEKVAPPLSPNDFLEDSPNNLGVFVHRFVQNIVSYKVRREREEVAFYEAGHFWPHGAEFYLVS